jgi:hypothetical protein
MEITSKMSKKTVFVIGAGASKEANLPTGVELKGIIAHLLNMKWNYHTQIRGDSVISQSLRNLIKSKNGTTEELNSYIHEGWHINKALPLAISIDNFIDAHRGNEKIALCGKLAIVRSILEAEKNSSLFFKHTENEGNIDFTQLEGAWYLPFFQLLTENCRVEDLKERLTNITLIIFNYDRCIEHFLLNTLRSYYKISMQDAAEIVKCINIYHPYGSVGSLPVLDYNTNTTDFGSTPTPKLLLQLASDIKTFTEGTNPESSEILEIKRHMGEAERLVYIGFAFHKLNMQLITPDNVTSVPKCFSTTLGISDKDKYVIADQINEQYSQVVESNMADLKCGPFFNEFWRNLSF